MYLSSTKINKLIKTIVFGSTKSKNQTTPNIIKNGRLSPYGYIQKKPKTYDYVIPQDLPNRHLYYNRTQSNRITRKRYHKHRLYKLKIQPIHDQQGKRTFNRKLPQLLSQLTSINLIRQSLNRTLENLHQVILRFSQQVIGKNVGDNFEQGQHSDILKYAMHQIHQRHLSTMNFYQFSTYCQLRYRARLQPTQELLIHFHKQLKQVRDLNKSLSLTRLAKLSKYIFSIKYSEQYMDFIFKKQKDFKLFSDQYLKDESIETIIQQIYTQEEVKKVSYNDEQLMKMRKGLKKLPGGHKLLQILQNTN